MYLGLYFWLSLGSVGVGLVWFGVWYNRWVERLQDDGSDRGYVSLLVVVGVVVTVLGVTMVVGVLAGPGMALAVLCIELVLFLCSGMPMVWGSVARHLERRREKQMGWRAMTQGLVDLARDLGGEDGDEA